MRKNYFFAVVAVLAISFQIAYSVDYYVSQSGNNSDGLSWTNAFNDVQDAIAASTSGDIIYIAKGVYYPHSSDRAFSFALKEGVEVYGGFEGTETPIDQAALDGRDFVLNETILSGDLSQDDGPNFTNMTENSYHVVNIYNKTGIVLDGFTITKGYAHGDSSLLQADGAGILIKYASPVLRNLVIDSCWALRGGAMSILENSEPSISNIIVKDNKASYAAGIRLEDAYPIISDSWFYSNYALIFGGAILNRTMATTSKYPHIVNCTFYKNSAHTDIWHTGGVIHHYSHKSAPLFTNCILWGNSNDYYNENKNKQVSNDVSTVKLKFDHCIIQGAYFGGVSWDPAVGFNVAGNLDVNPQMIEPDSLDFRLFTNSAAFNVGNTTYGNNIGWYQDAGVPAPLLNQVGSFTDFDSIFVGSLSAEQSIVFSASNIIRDVTIKPPVGFEISLTTGTGFVSDSIIIQSTAGDITDTDFFVRFSPGYGGDFVDSISFTGLGLEEYVTVMGFGAGTPSIDTLSDIETCSNIPIDSIAISFTDESPETATFYAFSTNQSVIADEGLSIVGSGTNRKLVINQAPYSNFSTTVWVVVKDEFNLKDSTSFNVRLKMAPRFDVFIDSFVNCTNDSSGIIRFYAWSGDFPFQYSLDGVNYLDTNRFTKLPVGKYLVRVKDNAGCYGQSDSIYVKSLSEDIMFYYTGAMPGYEPGKYNFSVNTNYCCNDAEVQLDDEPYTFQTFFENVPAGEHTIRVRVVATQCVRDTVILVGDPNLVENHLSEVVIFPNPNNGVFSIQNLSGVSILNYRVIDVSGREISDGKIIGNEGIIDLSSNAKGVYIIELKSNEVTRKYKVFCE